MNNRPKVFQLKPIIKKDKSEILIWSKDEDTARKNSRNTSMAALKGTSEPFSNDDLTFYENHDNAVTPPTNTGPPSYQ